MQSSSFHDLEAAPKAQTVLDIGGMFDAFENLEEISPDLDWLEAIADTWGIFHPAISAMPTVQEP
ncbi:hypothetical protein [Leptolyngbya sp. NIES-2104]|uniref:hypothetical protein n=1 Tax=Leptolyngbya sp. NIES-2104 TaxID=1552121 RepID=UPI0006EC760E|nr:hypothetical protein [Leptolyngbya sp. NIES-2104]GAP95372.1 hypothetical protein NIES2104_18940 [Leptolyngbya sp. NIES-2104]